jgi:hypothetical protein
MKKTICLSGLVILFSCISYAQKIQVGQQIFEVDPNFRYPVKQALIAKKDRKLTPFTWAKERNHPIF